MKRTTMGLGRSGVGMALMAGALVLACGQVDRWASEREEDSPEVAGRTIPAVDPSRVTQVLDDTGTSLGSVALTVECAPEASTLVTRGLALLHNMTHVEAEDAFREATGIDPGCALGYWGQAISWVHPVWPDVPSDDQFARGWELLQQARAAGFASDREEAWVVALEAYYAEGVDRTHPGDLEARLFTALTLIATAPGTDTTFANQIRAGEMAEEVLALVPDHPGALHYIIHAYDVPGLAERALSAARSYGLVAPENAHALHMTSHIFTRLGLWDESIDYNRRSAAAALSHPIGGATSHHHLHALDYLAYAYLQQGRDDEAREVRMHLNALDGPVVDNVVTAYAFAAVPVRIAVERRDWRAAEAIPARWPRDLTWDRYPHLEAIVRFGHALAAAQTGDLPTAHAAVERLEALQEAASELPDRYDWGAQVEIQKIGASAWLAFAEGDHDRALSLMRRATQLESMNQKHPVTPGEVVPAGELLGDMLLSMGRPGEARAAFRSVLERSPNRLNSIYGSARASEMAGDAAAAARGYADVVALTGPDSPLPEVAHAKAFLGAE
jgi:tetratricopeptide (TPR) repeat protein